jgi:hypothetical protein
MKRLRCVLFLGALVAGVGTSHSLVASGSYTARPPQPPATKKSFDRARYSLGQHLFDGKVKLKAQTEAEPQEKRLSALQAHLPKRLSKKTNLPDLAGKLTAEQLDALEYYVHQRFGK